MKHLFTLCIVAALATSCKKDYTCECTSTDTTGGVTTTTVQTIKAKSSKKDAEKWCEAFPKGTATVMGITVPVDDGSTKCEIK